jgi:hypothetical protein
MPEYEATPAGDVRRSVSDGSFAVTGDPAKMVDAMLYSADQSPAPRRLTLGRGAYDKIRAALVQRLAELDAQQAVAFSTKADDYSFPWAAALAMRHRTKLLISLAQGNRALRARLRVSDRPLSRHKYAPNLNATSNKCS